MILIPLVLLVKQRSKNRILFTILILIIYRLGTYVPLAGIDPSALQEIMASSQKVYLVCLICFQVVQLPEYDFRSGYNALYFSIIVQLLTGVSDYFKNLKEWGEAKEKDYSNNKIWNCINCMFAGLWSFRWFRKCR